MRWIALPAVALLAACQPRAADPRGVEPDETLLTVSASGRSDTRPDEARLQLGVQSQAGSAGEASRLNREKMDKVTAELARLGVKPDAIQTRNLSLQSTMAPSVAGSAPTTWSRSRLRDMTKVGEAVTVVTEAGANVLSGPDLRVSNREAANRSAYAEAYKAARARAEAYASDADLKIARVLAIYDGGESNVPPSHRRYVSMDAVAQTAAPPPPPTAPFSPGVNTTEVQVRVDFALAEK